MPRPLPLLLLSLLLLSACSDTPDTDAPDIDLTAEPVAAEPAETVYPMPEADMTLAEYAAFLQDEGLADGVDTSREGSEDEGHFVDTSELVLADATLDNAWAVAATLFDFPAAFAYDALPADATEIENPDKPDYLWEDNLIIERDADGAITSATRYLRGEGGGSTWRIERTANGWKLSDSAIAD